MDLILLPIRGKNGIWTIATKDNFPLATTTIPNFLLGNVRQVFVMGNSSRLGIGWKFSWGKFLVFTTYTLQAICIMLPVYWAILWHVVYWALIEGCGHCSPLVVLVNLDGKVACQVLSWLLWCVVTGITLHSACSGQVLLKLFFCKSRGPLPHKKSSQITPHRV